MTRQHTGIAFQKQKSYFCQFKIFIISNKKRFTLWNYFKMQEMW